MAKMRVRGLGKLLGVALMTSMLNALLVFAFLHVEPAPNTRITSDRVGSKAECELAGTALDYEYGNRTSMPADIMDKENWPVMSDLRCNWINQGVQVSTLSPAAFDAIRAEDRDLSFVTVRAPKFSWLRTRAIVSTSFDLDMETNQGSDCYFHRELSGWRSFYCRPTSVS